MSNTRASRQVVLASTVMLSFISFWRAAAIVLNDLGSTAYYVGGISEQAVGKSAPWFVLGIMLFSYAVRAVYIESCSMFVRGGVYRVVHEAMGGTLAKFSVSALMFDYVLTGPISGVSAGLYLAGLLNDTRDYFHLSAVAIPPAPFAVLFAIAATFYFWWKNIIGIPESSRKALRIMQVTTVMVVILLAWCLWTIARVGYQPVPFPLLRNIHFSKEALGWLTSTKASAIPAIALLIGLGHSLLAMSGEESMAQVYREIAAPKLKNLERAGFVIFLYSLVFTAGVSFLAVMIIPDSTRTLYMDNLIGGLSMSLVGPLALRLIFHAFVVVVGTLILAGAINTAIIGSNGVLNRVAEDGILTDWFRHPHKRYGTTHRIINSVVILQILTIVISGGNVYMLGEAYAFGVMWSFAMKALSVLILRYKKPEAREWKVPLNFRIGNIEIPVGLGLITLALFALATINVLTKKTATISGISFTIAFFIAFEISEKYNRRRAIAHGGEREKFLLTMSDDLSDEKVQVRPGNLLVAVRNPHRLDHLSQALRKTNTLRQDVVVMSVRNMSPSDEYELNADQLFTDQEHDLFTKVVAIAEKEGKTIQLLVVPGVNAFDAIVQTATNLKSSILVTGVSSRMDTEELAQRFGHAWEKTPQPRHALSLEIIPAGKPSVFVNLGPHPPRLWPEDIDMAHELWLELSATFGPKVHHRDVVGLALRRMKKDFRDGARPEILTQVEADLTNRAR
ncbi:MAG TPA: APC family permease [Terriglobia bacterium]|nr:APC family permease [Terriglobia bacterium]